MKQFKDLIGLKFTRWTVIGTSNKTNRHRDRYWLCQCDCKDKTIREVADSSLLRGISKSCGCLSKEISTAIIQEYNRNKIPNNTINATKHSDVYPYYKRLRSIYEGMKKRCYEPYDSNYKNYGARGITICQGWLDDFMSFYDWSVENGYKDDLTIDRIDNDGSYEPNNCRWATMKEQCYNKSNTIHITIDGESKTIQEWSDISGLSWSVLWQRYFISELTTKEQLFKPLKRKTVILYKGQEKTLVEISLETGLQVETLRWRYKNGYKDDELTRPPGRWFGYEKGCHQ